MTRTAAGTQDGQLARGPLLLALVLVVGQDAVYALIFLSYMNHYLLDVLRTSPALPGYTLALYGATKLVTHPLAGRLLDRTSPRVVFRMAVLVQSGAVVLFLTWHTLLGFLVASFLLAAAAASMWPLIYETVARTQSADARPRAAGLVALVGYVATGVGFALGVILTRAWHWRAAFFAAAVLVAGPIFLQGAKSFDRRGARGHPTHADGGGQGRRSIGVFAAVIFLDYAAIASLAGVYGPYARTGLHIPLLRTVMLLAPAGAAALTSLFIAARFSRPDRRFLEMGALYVLAAPSAFALALTSTPSLAALFAVPLAIGVGGIGPIVASTMLDMGNADSRGFVIGALMSVEGLGSVAGPAGTAGIIDLFGVHAGVAFVGCIFALLIPLTGFAWLRLRAAPHPNDRPGGGAQPAPG